MALLLGLLKFALRSAFVRKALMRLIRSPMGRRFLRTSARSVGRLILASLSAQRRSR